MDFWLCFLKINNKSSWSKEYNLCWEGQTQAAHIMLFPSTLNFAGIHVQIKVVKGAEETMISCVG